MDGNRFVSGPDLPFIPSGSAKFCATKISDSLTFLGSEFDTFIYDWEAGIYLSPSQPLFRIDGSGCGTAISSEGEVQVVVAGANMNLKLLFKDNFNTVINL